MRSGVTSEQNFVKISRIIEVTAQRRLLRDECEVIAVIDSSPHVTSLGSTSHALNSIVGRKGSRLEKRSLFSRPLCVVKNVRKTNPTSPCTGWIKRSHEHAKENKYIVPPGRNGVEAFTAQGKLPLERPIRVIRVIAPSNRERLGNSFSRPSQEWFRINDRRPTSPACRSISLPARRPISS